MQLPYQVFQIPELSSLTTRIEELLNLGAFSDVQNGHHQVMTGDDVKKLIPRLHDFYLGEGLRLSSAYAGKTLYPLLREKPQINITVFRATEYAHKWHHDTYEIISVAYFCQTPPQGGGELLIATDEWQGIRLILPKRIQRFFDKMCIWLAERNLMKIETVAVNPGMLLVAHGQKYIHQVQPLQDGKLRIAAILTYSPLPPAQQVVGAGNANDEQIIDLELNRIIGP
jgi:hypothetical protein